MPAGRLSTRLDPMATYEQMQNWTPERVERLKKLLAEGLSAGQIALQLDANFTRNAVIGKVGREGLKFARGARARRLLGIAARPTRTQDPMPRLKPVAVLREMALAPKFNPEPYVPAVVDLPAEPLNVGLLDLEHGMCKFPTTAEAPHLFCGLPIVKGRPYCSAHVAACYHKNSNAKPIGLPRSLIGRAA
jgi:GcrA cell cycle regulator